MLERRDSELPSYISVRCEATLAMKPLIFTKMKNNQGEKTFCSSSNKNQKVKLVPRRHVLYKYTTQRETWH
jgi:hypothetical protein